MQQHGVGRIAPAQEILDLGLALGIDGAEVVERLPRIDRADAAFGRQHRAGTGNGILEEEFRIAAQARHQALVDEAALTGFQLDDLFAALDVGRSLPDRRVQPGGGRFQQLAALLLGDRRLTRFLLGRGGCRRQGAEQCAQGAPRGAPAATCRPSPAPQSVTCAVVQRCRSHGPIPGRNVAKRARPMRTGFTRPRGALVKREPLRVQSALGARALGRRLTRRHAGAHARACRCVPRASRLERLDPNRCHRWAYAST